MSKITTWIIIAVLIIGGIASMDLLPKTWFDRIPAWGQVLLVVSVIVFSASVVIGYVLDSGLIQRIFRKREP